MNHKLLFFAITMVVVLVTTAFVNTSSNEYTLKDALLKKLVTVQVYNNTKSSHYGQPILLQVANLKNYPIKLKVEKGSLFEPDLPQYQTIIISNDQQMPLAANQEKSSYLLYGFCVESHDAAPGSKKISYQLGKKAEPKVCSMVDFISKENLQGSYEGQNAVWVLVNNQSLDNVIGFDTLSTNKLHKFMSKLTGKPMPPPPAKNDYKRNYHATEYRPKLTVRGQVNLQGPRSSKVQIGLFDSANICVRELYVNNAVPKGKQSVGYSFDASEYQNRYYYIKTMVDDVIVFHSRYDFKTGKIWQVERRF
jgi:hypothetical protein